MANARSPGYAARAAGGGGTALIISCERCSTAYELDESLLASEGSPVQCTRCQHVFTACPPGKRAQTLAGARSAEAAAAPVATVATVSVSAVSAVSEPAASEASVPARAPARARVPACGAPAPVYRPIPGASSASVRGSPVLRQDTIETFESRLRWSARLRWLVPTAAVALLAVGAGAYWKLAPGGASAPASMPASVPAPMPVAVPVAAPVEAAAGEAIAGPPAPTPSPPPGAGQVPSLAASSARSFSPSTAAGERNAAARNESSQPLPAAEPIAVPAPAPQPVRRVSAVLAPAAIPEPDATSALPVIDPPAAVHHAVTPAGGVADEPFVTADQPSAAAVEASGGDGG